MDRSRIAYATWPQNGRTQLHAEGKCVCFVFSFNLKFSLSLCGWFRVSAVCHMLRCVDEFEWNGFEMLLLLQRLCSSRAHVFRNVFFFDFFFLFGRSLVFVSPCSRFCLVSGIFFLSFVHTWIILIRSVAWVASESALVCYRRRNDFVVSKWETHVLVEGRIDECCLTINNVIFVNRATNTTIVTIAWHPYDRFGPKGNVKNSRPTPATNIVENERVHDKLRTNRV